MDGTSPVQDSATEGDFRVGRQGQNEELIKGGRFVNVDNMRFAA